MKRQTKVIHRLQVSDVLRDIVTSDLVVSMLVVAALVNALAAL